MRVVRALILAMLLLVPETALATPPPTAQEIAEAMRSCLPITNIEPHTIKKIERSTIKEDDDTEFRVTVDGMPEPFSVGPSWGNFEHYYHWWAPDVKLSFVRYPMTVEPPAPGREMRDWRNRVIRCFFWVPPIPDDFVRHPSEIARAMAACLSEKIGMPTDVRDIDVGYRYLIEARLKGDPSASPEGRGFRPQEDATMSIDLMSEWDDPDPPHSPAEHVVPYWWGVTRRYAVARHRGWVTPELEQATDECLATGVRGQ